jgi:2-polyprenyl-3-methyl-5-hydroxy-6-metoxy-1,4-benzoquinol methylase
MNRVPWNHNVHYHEFLLKTVPENCDRALDVGCGQGLLARRLAPRCGDLVAIDIDQDALNRAVSADSPNTHATYVRGDVMTHRFPQTSFDLITAVATLHHLPLKPALMRFKDLLRPSGVLVVIGLYRNSTLTDYAFAAAALPTSKLLRLWRGEAAVGAPVKDPEETLEEIRAACNEVLPGATIQRHLFFRYSLIWRNSGAGTSFPDF